MYKKDKFVLWVGESYTGTTLKAINSVGVAL